MTILEALKKYKEIEIELLLAHVLRKPKEFLFMEPDFRLTRSHADRLTRVTDRRLKGEPVAYILGYKDFMGLRFKVNQHVLIPRPETEMVVSLVSAKLQDSPPLGEMPSAAEAERVQYDKRQPLPSPLLRRRGSSHMSPVKILDVGTGSGCIAVTLATQFSISNFKFSITASDISPAALKVARQNAKEHKARVKFVQSDLLKNIKGDFDIIIANLPYGWHGVKNSFSSVKDGLKFEPQKALYTQERGLLLIHRLLDKIAAKDNKPKLVYLEFDPRQKSDLSVLIKKSLPGSKTKFYKDYNNFWRYAEISLK